MKFINYLPDKLEYSYDESSKSLKLKFYDNDSGCYECEYFSVVKNGDKRQTWCSLKEVESSEAD